MRRILLCLALMFPIIYLCGGLFFGLAGAHGEQIFSIDGESTSLKVNMTRGVGIDLETGQFGNYNQSFSSYVGYYHFDDDLSFTLDTEAVSGYNARIFYYDENKSFISYTQFEAPRSGLVDVSRGYYFTFSVYLGMEFTLSITNFSSVGTQYINSVAYTDFIFSQPFAKNNFISTLGTDLINGSTKGFNPMNELFRTINTNIMHFEDTDSLAMFGLGYVYYSVNVLIIYEILILAVKLIMLPLKAVDLFDKEDKI